MAARSRSRDRSTTIGGFTTLDGVGPFVQGYTGSGDHESCQDTTMPRPYDVDHNLLIDRRSVLPLRINGSTEYNAPPTGQKMHFDSYNPQNCSTWTQAPAPSAFSTAYWLTRALANMDPYRPLVDLPLFLFEFKDFPAMLRHAGRVLSFRGGGKAKPEDGPGAILAYQFGWAPLVSDVLSLFNLAKSIDDRMRYLRNLEKGSRVRRSLGKHEIPRLGDPISYSTFALNTGSFAYRADVATKETTKVWYTANAKLLEPLPEDFGELRVLSAKIVTGLTFRPWSVWDYLPWTWLIDYFLNIGDLLEARGALCSLRVTRLCLMSTTEVIRSHSNVRTAPGLSALAPTFRTVVKRRSAHLNPTPRPAFVPFLTGSQMLNLGALLTAGAARKVAS